MKIYDPISDLDNGKQLLGVFWHRHTRLGLVYFLIASIQINIWPIWVSYCNHCETVQRYRVSWNGLQSSEDRQCSSMIKIDRQRSFLAQAHHPRFSFEIIQLCDFWCRRCWPLGLHHFLHFVIIKYAPWGKYTIPILHGGCNYISNIFVIISHISLSIINYYP